MNRDVHGDHVGLGPSTPRMAESRSSVKAPMVSPVLMILKALSGEASVATTSAVVMGSETGAGLEDGMAAGEELLGIDVGDGAGGGDFEVAANELHADGGTGNDAGDGRGGDGAEGAVGAGLDDPLPPRLQRSRGRCRPFAAARSEWLRGGIRS